MSEKSQSQTYRGADGIIRRRPESKPAAAPAAAPERQHAQPQEQRRKPDVLTTTNGRTVTVQTRGPSEFRGVVFDANGGSLVLRNATERRWLQDGTQTEPRPAGKVFVERNAIAFVRMDDEPALTGAEVVE